MNGGSAGDLISVLGMLKRRLWVIVLVVALAVSAAYLLSQAQEEQFKATSTLLFRDPGLDQQVTGLPSPPPGDPERIAETNVGLVSLGIVRKRAAKRLGRKDDRTLGAITAALKGKSNLVTVTATTSAADTAAGLANAAAEEFVKLRREAARKQLVYAERGARRELRRMDGASRRRFVDNVRSLRLLRSAQTGNVELVERATPPRAPSSPKLSRNLLMGGLAGLLLGLALALLVEQLDRRVR